MGFYLLIIGLLFALGLAIGSFINVVIYRMVHNDSALRGRSYCDNCKEPIAWYDNIPLVSFLLLHRRCRHCGAPIPWEYPAVEFLTGSLFIWWYFIGSTFFRLSAKPFLFLQPLFWLFVGLILVVIFFADFIYFIIPDSAVLLLGLATLGYRLLLTTQHIMMPRDFYLSIVSGVAAGLFFLFLYLATRRKGMGLGDVKYVVVMGLLLGWPSILVGLFMAFVIGASVGVSLIVLGKKHLQSRIPFGPFLVIGTLIALLWGEKLATMYLSTLL